MEDRPQPVPVQPVPVNRKQKPLSVRLARRGVLSMGDSLVIAIGIVMGLSMFAVLSVIFWLVIGAALITAAAGA